LRRPLDKSYKHWFVIIKEKEHNFAVSNDFKTQYSPSQLSSLPTLFTLNRCMSKHGDVHMEGK